MFYFTIAIMFCFVCVKYFMFIKNSIYTAVGFISLKIVYTSLYFIHVLWCLIALLYCIHKHSLIVHLCASFVHIFAWNFCKTDIFKSNLNLQCHDGIVQNSFYEVSSNLLSGLPSSLWFYTKLSFKTIHIILNLKSTLNQGRWMNFKSTAW